MNSQTRPGLEACAFLALAAETTIAWMDDGLEACPASRTRNGSARSKRPSWKQKLLGLRVAALLNRLVYAAVSLINGYNMPGGLDESSLAMG